ncbi:ATP12 family chaperone protein [Qingshengfaniella alkalisoli]|uniref:ATPase n=1 Tax=Qingshengfaniella alkalisoli TaxID=2599296 RepID=A0A5B8J692_9RHOB|nr:ATP12 family protein [Qingshengfaniella alkalisoli]QDY69860.1 ATPase [Qingshengfaniella alkalisoli]
MTEWARKRFWTDTKVVEATGGYEVQLDGRSLKTPAKSALILPNLQVAELLRDEWEAQQEVVDPETMPATRMANSAIDKVAPQQREVAELIAAYGESDLLCYRATTPQELIERQAQAWDPILGWAAVKLGAQLETAAGVMFVPQPVDSVAALTRRVHRFNHWQLAAFHDLVALSGSLVIGFAAAARHLPLDHLWGVSRIDETWQQEQWGVDEEAAQAAETKRDAFLRAGHFLSLLL